MHAQTINEYPDAKNTFEYHNSEQISERSEYLLQPYYHVQHEYDTDIYTFSLGLSDIGIITSQLIIAQIIAITINRDHLRHITYTYHTRCN